MLSATGLAIFSKCLVFKRHHSEKNKTRYCSAQATTFTNIFHLLCCYPFLQAVCECAFHGNFPSFIGFTAQTVMCTVMLPLMALE